MDRAGSEQRSWASSPDLHVALRAGGGRRVALERALRAAICSGRLRPGERLPSTRGLAHDLGLARGTVAEAYAQLAAEGYLRTRPGAPTRVAPDVRSPRWTAPRRPTPGRAGERCARPSPRSTVRRGPSPA